MSWCCCSLSPLVAMDRGHVAGQVTRLQKPVLAGGAGQQGDTTMLPTQVMVEVGATEKFVITQLTEKEGQFCLSVKIVFWLG